MKIFIDGDGCPVINLVIDIGSEFTKDILIYTDSAHIINRNGAKTIVVPQGKDSVDFELIKEVKENDVVVTQDYGLASLVLSKNAHGINQNGLIFNKFNIESLLFSRHMSQKLRNSGKRTKGPKKRTPLEDKEFSENFRKLLNKIKEWSIMKNLWRNKKNGKLYEVLSTAINATNKDDGVIMVLYTIDNRLFVREYEEFLVKFERSEFSSDIVEKLKSEI